MAVRGVLGRLLLAGALALPAVPVAPEAPGGAAAGGTAGATGSAQPAPGAAVPAAAQARASGCRLLLLLGARGSGEKQSDRFGGWGPTGAVVRDAVETPFPTRRSPRTGWWAWRRWCTPRSR